MSETTRILLVEDNHSDASLLRSQLQEAAPGQFRLEQAETLAKGVARLEAEPFDLVLLDLDLPDSTGLATVTRALAAAARAAIVVLTGFEDPTIGLEAVTKGAQDFLVKGQTTGPLLVRAMCYALERKRLVRELEEALANVKTLRGLLPICASCKRIRDDKGYWKQLESYLAEHSEADFTHGLCPECIRRLYPEYAQDVQAGPAAAR